MSPEQGTEDTRFRKARDELVERTQGSAKAKERGSKVLANATFPGTTAARSVSSISTCSPTA